MDWLDRIVWAAVLATLFCVASVIAGLLGAPANIWVPLGLAGITFALLSSRDTR